MKNFKKTYIEITNVCNLACDFCPKTKRKASFMSKEDFIKILDEIKGYSKHIYFHVKGEPMLHPDLEEFLDICYSKGFIVNITTNGTLINKLKDKLMGKPALRQINFSLHSFDANDNNFTMEKYLKDILDFTVESTSKTDLIVSLRLWNYSNEEINSKENKARQIDFNQDIHREKLDIKKVYSEEEKNAQVLETIEQTFKLDYKIKDVLVAGRGMKIAKNVYLNQASKFIWPDKLLDFSDEEGFCYGLRNQIAILVDGTVVPCCLDGEGVIKLGNLHETSFAAIVENQRSNNIYDGFTNHKVVEELCKKCDYRRRFGK